MSWPRKLALAAATLCLALSFGINYGKSNHAAYLLPTVYELHPELWTRDWMANTRHFHDAYAALGAVMLRLDPSGWAIGLANAVTVCLGMWLMWRLARALWRPEQLLPGFLLVLALCGASGTHGAGGSYVFGDIFQPSSLGSLGLLLAVSSFARGSAPLAGLGLGFAGVFHVNYLLLGLCVFGVAWLLSGSERRLSRAAWLLGPSLAVLAWSLPFLLASSGSALAAETRRIFQEVRAPHHFDVERFTTDFVPWLGFQLLGAWGLWGAWRSEQTPARRLLAVLIGFWALIVPGTLLSYFGVRAVNQLFCWRIAPHASLLAQIAFTGTLLARVASQPKQLLAPGVERWLVAVGLGLLALAAALGEARDVSLLTLAIAAGALLCARWVTGAKQEMVLVLVSGVAFVAAIASPLSKVSRRSDLLGGKDQDLAALCGWLGRSTARDTIVLTPPEEDEVRFRCERAIVVDWKSTPVIPEQVLEWVTRMEDVTGRRPLQGPPDTAGYRDLDQVRLAELRRKYGVEVVVVKPGTRLAREMPAPDFASGRFLAYRVREEARASPPH